MARRKTRKKAKRKTSTKRKASTKRTSPIAHLAAKVNRQEHRIDAIETRLQHRKMGRRKSGGSFAGTLDEVY